MLCFQDSCCKASNGNTEPEQHVSYCSIGVGVFLCVQTSMVLIARGLRGALWGSLYIDEHGEEDPGLRFAQLYSVVFHSKALFTVAAAQCDCRRHATSAWSANGVNRTSARTTRAALFTGNRCRTTWPTWADACHFKLR